MVTYKLSNPMYGQEGGGVAWTNWVEIDAKTFQEALTFLLENKGVCKICAFHKDFKDLVTVDSWHAPNPNVVATRIPNSNDAFKLTITVEEVQHEIRRADALAREHRVDEYAYDQWWIKSLHAAYAEGKFDNDTRRACKVALDYLAISLPPTIS